MGTIGEPIDESTGCYFTAAFDITASANSWLPSVLRAVVRKNWKFFLTSYNAMCYMYFHGISYKSAGHRAGKRYPAVLLDLPRTPGAGPGITERRRDRLGGRGSQHAHSDACPADAEQ